MKNEIILYRQNELAEHIEVRFDEDTVWLNRQQIAMLFGRDVKTIGKHINNVFTEGELDKKVVVANFATVTFLSNSPSVNTLLMCLPMVFTSLPKSMAICCRLSQTVFSSNLTSICSDISFGLYKIISFFISNTFLFQV